MQLWGPAGHSPTNLGVTKMKHKATIVALVHALLDLGYDNHRILACVRAAFPDGNTKLHNISWYRSERSRNGN
jgi:hypothetical protein